MIVTTFINQLMIVCTTDLKTTTNNARDAKFNDGRKTFAMFVLQRF